MQIADSRRYQGSDTVFEEGTTSDRVYIIQDGTVEFIRGQRVVGRRSGGMCFGELGAIDHLPRSATARVVKGPATILSISSNVLAERNGKVALKLYRNLANALASQLRQQSI